MATRSGQAWINRGPAALEVDAGCGVAVGLARKPLGKLAGGRGARRSFRRKPQQPPFEIGAIAAKPPFGDENRKHGGVDRLA